MTDFGVPLFSLRANLSFPTRESAAASKTRETVTIGRKLQTVMFVDDTGMLDGKPVNAKATALYRAIWKPGTLHSIHCDVVIE